MQILPVCERVPLSAVRHADVGAQRQPSGRVLAALSSGRNTSSYWSASNVNGPRPPRSGIWRLMSVQCTRRPPRMSRADSTPQPPIAQCGHISSAT